MLEKNVSSAPSRLVELTISSNSGVLPVVRSAVQCLAEMVGFSALDAQNITWAVDEALANVIKHGYGGQSDKPIHLRLAGIRHSDGREGLEATVRDYGRQVDPCMIQGRDLEDVRPGGLGVHVMRTVMDVVEYSCPVTGGMLLRMLKYVPLPGEPESAASEVQSA
jgi:anti-sigma regulatory factor (Ser/Thr protein kinase)